MHLNLTAARRLDAQVSMAIDAHIAAVVGAMARDAVRSALHWGGYATFDDEPTEVLRECLRGAVADGEISLSEVQ